MAENEILDLGHRRRWLRTRRVLSADGCSVDDVLVAAQGDIEGVCRALAVALRKGDPLRILLEPALRSSAASQAVIAQFQEKRLAIVVRDVIKLCGSADPSIIATLSANKIVVGLTEQLGLRAGRNATFRSLAARRELSQQVSRIFAGYEGALRCSIEASLRGAQIKPFKSSVQRASRLPPSQVVALSVTRPVGHHHAP